MEENKVIKNINIIQKVLSKYKKVFVFLIRFLIEKFSHWQTQDIHQCPVDMFTISLEQEKRKTFQKKKEEAKRFSLKIKNFTKLSHQDQKTFIIFQNTSWRTMNRGLSWKQTKTLCRGKSIVLKKSKEAHDKLFLLWAWETFLWLFIGIQTPKKW